MQNYFLLIMDFIFLSPLDQSVYQTAFTDLNHQGMNYKFNTVHNALSSFVKTDTTYKTTNHNKQSRDNIQISPHPIFQFIKIQDFARNKNSCAHTLKEEKKHQQNSSKRRKGRERKTNGHSRV